MMALPERNSKSSSRSAAKLGIVAACAVVAACAQPEAPSQPAASSKAVSSAAPSEVTPPPADHGPVAPLAWLAGCWQGTVNQRDFREQWLPYRGGMLVGAGQQVMKGAMQDYEFLRIEARSDGVYFSQFGGDRKEASFRLAGTTTDKKDTIFAFANTSSGFPAHLVYRRGTDGWLYETIEGSLNGSDKKVIYPLRRVDCETGELILK